MRYIGDVHGRLDTYRRQVDGCADSVQVGDLGIGVREIPDLGLKHRFIRGNHDDPQACRAYRSWIIDGTVDDNIMFIGGAESTDRAARREGIDWWSDEELSYADWRRVCDIYAQAKPRVMVTHDCPWMVAEALFRPEPGPHSSTRDHLGLFHRYRKHRPAVWVFGHWHEDRDEVIDGIRYICLGEGSHIDLDDSLEGGEIQPWGSY